MKIFVGSSSHNDIPQKYLKNNYLKKILKGNDLVFGASKDGLMGQTYNIAKENNKKVIASLPKFYNESLEGLDCTETFITNTMPESTIKAINSCDIILFIPGGLGTLYEIFFSIQTKICHEHNKPIIIYNYLHFYDDIIKQLNKMLKENFIKQKDTELYHISNNINDVLSYLKEIK